MYNMTPIYGDNGQFQENFNNLNFQVRFIPIGQEEILLPGEHKHGPAVQDTVDIRLSVEQAQQRLIPASNTGTFSFFFARGKGLNLKSYKCPPAYGR